MTSSRSAAITRADVMSPVQQQAFDAGMGVIHAHSSLRVAIASCVIITAMIWWVWLSIGHFKQWYRREIDIFEFKIALLRGLGVVLILLFFVR